MNYIRHALFVQLLLPSLLRKAKKPDSDVRIVFLTSLGWCGHSKGGIVFNGLRTVQNFGLTGVWIRYGQSKIVNILYAAESAQRYPNIMVSSVHPGVANTGLVSNLSVLQKVIVYITYWAALRHRRTLKLINYRPQPEKGEILITVAIMSLLEYQVSWMETPKVKCCDMNYGIRRKRI